MEASTKGTIAAISLAGVASSIVVVAQTMIQFEAPEKFWGLVQTNTQFWASLQTLVFAVEMGVVALCRFVYVWFLLPFIKRNEPLP